jgi:hypothetical protein
MLGEMIAVEPRILRRFEQRHAVIVQFMQGLVALIDIVENTKLHFRLTPSHLLVCSGATG